MEQEFEDLRSNILMRKGLGLKHCMSSVFGGIGGTNLFIQEHDKKRRSGDLVIHVGLPT